MFPSPTHQDPRNAPSHRSFLDARGRADLDPFIVTEGMHAHRQSLSRSRRDTPSYGAEQKLIRKFGCFWFCPEAAVRIGVSDGWKPDTLSAPPTAQRRT